MRDSHTMREHLLVTASVTAPGLDVRNAEIGIHKELVEVGKADKNCRSVVVNCQA